MLIGRAGVSAADDLHVSLHNGRVTIVADQVPVRRILEEWARVGQVRVVNLDKVSGPAVTLRLIDVPEERALGTLLRSVAGYVAAPRAVASDGTSQFDRLVILATSRPPATSPASSTVSRPPPAMGPQVVPAPDVADPDAPARDPNDPEAGPPRRPPFGPEGMAPVVLPPNPLPFPGTGAASEDAPPVTAPQPGPIPGAQGQPQIPTALPRPGFVPLPTTPGTATPTPPQPPRKPGGGG